MQVALLGGTGDIGEGLALRWAYHTTHEVIIGSRDAEKARRKANEYEAELKSRGEETEITGFDNKTAVKHANIIVLAVPPYHITDTIETIADSLAEGDVLVTPATGIKRDDDGFHYHRPQAGSVTQLAADAKPDGVPLVGAFHNLASGRLADLDVDLNVDTLLVADDDDAKETIRKLAQGIEGLRPLDAGSIANAAEIEALTPLLINVAMNNQGMHDLGIRFR